MRVGPVQISAPASEYHHGLISYTFFSWKISKYGAEKPRVFLAVHILASPVGLGDAELMKHRWPINARALINSL